MAVTSSAASRPGAYAAAHRRSIEDPEGFWLDAAREIDWTVPPSKALDASRAPLYRWFPDGELNTCHNAVDRHVEAGHGDRLAIVHDSPVTGTVTRLTYRELRDETARLAGLLSSWGVAKGDRVVIYMPMVPQAAVAMLACARIGAVHSVVFGGFAAHELAVRIDDARPKVVLTASCGIEPSRTVPYKPLLDSALEQAAHRPERCLVLQRPQYTAALTEGRDADWAEAVAGAEPVGCTPVAATDPLYILYTSGTTGRPKGVVRDNGGHAVALRWSLGNIFDTHPGEVFWAASDVGWVVGHSYIVYGPLLAGCTTVLYEGKPVGTPDAGAFWRVVADHGVKTLFTAPTAIRVVKKEDPEGELFARHDTGSLRVLFLAGERLDPQTYHWAGALLGVPVVDNWWQTETGWPIVADPMGLEPHPTKPGSPTLPVPGYDVRILGEDGREVPDGTDGAVALKLPLPPGTLPTLWGDDQRYIDSYLSVYEGYYLSGDGGRKDEDGYVYIMGRVDDVLNVAGHRLSSGAMEEVLAGHPDVAECAVIGVRDELKGQVPRGLVVLKAGVDRAAEEIAAELVAAVREQIGPVAALRRIDVVAGLPKTRSGKILRRTMRDIADGGDPALPSTIEDPAVIGALRPVLRDDS
ncbi:propionyl-CoA synthetase [Streptomyces xinghaiensis]|uniref:propionyl-CoA synthetase n=1 Tax=Streptomyces xinghaiensis TaxID=1038928 RepID=UPI000593C65F|nr:propionyl-CoA synthetase [Streptomyces xinghaiensis]MZE81454.1 acetate--CoA ligase [Streptomyces sp. SID5475]